MLDPSVQLYTVRTAFQADPGKTLGELAGFGYTQVEPYGFVEFLDELRALPAYGLTAPTAHVGLLDADQDAVFAAATELGISTVIHPMSDPARWGELSYVQGLADGLNAAAERAKEHGLRVGYHNHHFELENRIDGRHALEVLADHLSDDVVLEVDTYWAYAGGADVPALLRTLGDRVVALHIKDGDGSLDTKAQLPVGEGDLPVWDFIAAAPHALPVVELDDSEQDLVAATGASREYLLAGPAGAR